MNFEIFCILGIINLVMLYAIFTQGERIKEQSDEIGFLEKRLENMTRQPRTVNVYHHKTTPFSETTVGNWTSGAPKVQRTGTVKGNPKIKAMEV